MPMSDKVLRAINKGRRKAGLKPIRRKTNVDEVQKRRARNTSKVGALQARENLKNIRKKWDIEEQTKYAKRYIAKGKAIMRKKGIKGSVFVR